MNRSLVIGCLAVIVLNIPATMPVSAADWKDSDCRNDKDDSGNRVDVCRDGASIGVFWDDGSFVNGWCDGRAYDIDYKGLSKKDAVSWIEYYC